MNKRIAKKITLDEFKQIVSESLKKISEEDCLELLLEEFISVSKKILSDIEKIDFDFENFNYEDNEGVYGTKNLIGYHQLENGLSFIGCVAGGDWEYPVFFIIYHDGNVLRGYIPEDGNVFNEDTQSAYFNNDDSGVRDVKNLIKKYESKFEEGRNYFSLDIFSKDYEDLDENKKNIVDIDIASAIKEEFLDFDWDKVKKDIEKTIEVRDKPINPRLEERPDWDQYFVAFCEVLKSRSLDPHTQVGCVIVNDRNRVIATGYNSWPPGCKDEEIPFERPEKYTWITHSEINAIISCGKDLKDCTIYVPFLPCPDCFKAIISAGIKHVKYYGTYESGVNKDDVVRKMAKMTGISLEFIEVEIPIILWKNSLAKHIKK